MVKLKQLFCNLVIQSLEDEDRFSIYYKDMLKILKNYQLFDIDDIENMDDLIFSEKFIYLIRKQDNQSFLFDDNITFEQFLLIYLMHINVVEDTLMIDEMILLESLDEMLCLEIINIEQRINNIKNGLDDINTNDTLEYAIVFLNQILKIKKEYIYDYLLSSKYQTNIDFDGARDFILDEKKLLQSIIDRLLNCIRNNEYVNYESVNMAPYLYPIRARERVIKFPSTKESRKRIALLQSK